MKRGSYTAIIMFLALGNAVISAETMSWKSVVTEAGKNSPVLKKAEEAASLAGINHKIALSNFYPQISGSAGTSYSDSPRSSSGGNYSLGLSGRMSLFSGFSDVAEKSSRSLDMAIAAERLRRAWSDVYYNLKKSYITLLWSQESVGLTQDISVRRLKNYELIGLKYQAGTEDKGALLRVEADKFQTEYELLQAKRNLDEASRELVRDIGYETYGMITATGPLRAESPEGTPDFNSLVSRTPEYLISKYAVDKAEFGIISARSSRYPDLSLSAGLSSSDTVFPPGDPGLNAGLSLSYLFYSGKKTGYGIQIAELNSSIAGATLKEIGLSLSVSVVGAWNDLQSAVENVKIREKYLKASEEQSRITTAKYLNGLVTYFDWYNVENEYINARKALLNAERDSSLALAFWQNKLGNR